jgi:hypothetical protein
VRRLIAPMGWLWLALAPVLSAAQTLVPQNGTAASGLTGQVAIANGGTGQSSLAAAGLPVLIATSTPAGVGTVTFASIPNTYRDLQVRVRGAGAAAASFVNVGVQFNGDAGANYDFQENVTNNTTPGGSANVAQTSVAIGYLPAASGVANLGGGAEATIFDYAGSTLFKDVLALKGVRLSGSASGYFAGMVWGSWRNSNAITSVTVVLSSGAFAAGSTVSLYGIP